MVNTLYSYTCTYFLLTSFDGSFLLKDCTTELSARPPQETTTTEIRTRYGRLIKPPKKFDIES